jgi:hypothetical protein
MSGAATSRRPSLTGAVQFGAGHASVVIGNDLDFRLAWLGACCVMLYHSRPAQTVNELKQYFRD